MNSVIFCEDVADQQIMISRELFVPVREVVGFSCTCGATEDPRRWCGFCEEPPSPRKGMVVGYTPFKNKKEVGVLLKVDA